MRRLEVDFPSVIPAEAGIQVSWVVVSKSVRQRLDAGPVSRPGQALRRHDGSSLRLKARDFNHPRETLNRILHGSDNFLASSTFPPSISAIQFRLNLTEES
jgi:hypothetical protein